MTEQEQINKQVEYLANKIPCALYWLDLNYIVVGVNNRLLKAIGAKSRKDIIGKTVYEFYPQHIADGLQADFKVAIKTGVDIEHEHVIEDISTGKIRYFAATVSPLRDSKKVIIGVIGTSIEITAEKETQQRILENERLKLKLVKLENERYGAIAQDREKGMRLADKMYRDQQADIVRYLHPNAGNIKDENISLSLRDSQVMYAMYRKRDAKSAAGFLSKMIGEDDNQAAVNAILNKSLYPKFNVNNQDKLFEKALLLKMIPLFFPTEEKPRKPKK